ncbi:YraN family protein [Nodosilinea sp. LEGE 07088]|uniref:YraN family protein n=1 Tax=Nodosilinea sp. LEGE 07088 TaxID=2777968 RepID=UPI001882C2B6|nr:YraN family protein [Nodosilinea sp. LEGE 07088]MBE9139641.1 YraN family protein [Nodosilinea sp. LEGE 07088]
MTGKISQTELGTLGETLVSNWLRTQGWQQLDRQWHCRWGELDLVMAQGPACANGQLAFVEVKTRSQGNWDAYGLMAITRSKQAKLWKAAQLYLLQHPQWAEATCRFDVALVACRFKQPQINSQGFPNYPAAKHLAIDQARYLVLQDYIESAFDAPHR